MNPSIIQGAIALILLSWSGFAEGQSLGRKVFSAGGATSTIGIQHYAYTFGEPIIGTDLSNLPILTRGFHQPIIDNVLNAHLEYFTGMLTGNDGLLQWQFAGFPFPAAFEVYREWGDNGLEKLGTLSVDPDAQVVGEYTFTDPGVVLLPTNRATYRLKMSFPDGSFTFSHWVEINWEKRPGASLLAYPNPADETLHIVFSVESPAAVELLLLNAMGQLLRREVLADSQGSIQHRWEVSDLPSGVYVLSVQYAGKREELLVQVMH